MFFLIIHLDTGDMVALIMWLHYDIIENLNTEAPNVELKTRRWCLGFCPPVATVLVVLVEYTVLVPPFGNPMSKLPTKLTPHWLCPSFIESQVGADGHEHSSWPSSYRLTPLRNNHVITKHERAHFYSSKRRLFSFRVSLPSSSSIAVIEFIYKNSAGCWSHLWHTFILNSKDWRLERRAEEQRAWN